MFDKIDKIGKSIIQHGPNNDRVYLMKLFPQDVERIIDDLYDLAILKRYSKIFVKVPEWALDVFQDNNYKIEASIPEFYSRTTKCYFLSQFFSAKRSFLSKKDKKEIDSIIELSSNYFSASEIPSPKDYHIKELSEHNVKSLAQLYKAVFKVYPFPIFKEKYLLETMNKNVRYFGVFEGDKLIAASSAEMDVEGQNAEMTDFATDPKYLGQNLSYFLLQAMESEMSNAGIHTAYTLARAHSHGMNKTFGRSEYLFGGTLINNTNIGQSIESMNVWYKPLKGGSI
jgi:putative beta-lysine N-acetyltransferase